MSLDVDLDADEDAGPDFSTPEQIGLYADWLLGDAKKNAPFYWKRWNGGQQPESRLQSDMIVGTFAYHLSEILALKPEERVLEFPVGALTLAILGATHTLKHYTTGKWATPDGRLGWFSSENYGDTVEFKDGHYVPNKRLTRVLNVVKNLSDDEWIEIYAAAYDVIKRRGAVPASKGRGKKVASRAVVVAPDEDDDELMLAPNA